MKMNVVYLFRINKQTQFRKKKNSQIRCYRKFVKPSDEFDLQEDDEDELELEEEEPEEEEVHSEYQKSDIGKSGKLSDEAVPS